MRNPPRIWRGGGKGPRRAVVHQPPPSREVTVEVFGVNPGLQRIDIVADPNAHQPGTTGTPPEPEESRWDNIEDALAATKGPARPDPWDRLTR